MTKISKEKSETIPLEEKNQKAHRAFLALSKRTATWVSEEEVRVQWIKAIENSLGVELDAERNRKDANYNNVIIEFKSPGLFKGKITSPAFKKATQEQLPKYIQAAALKDGLALQEYHAIAIDGNHISFAYIDKSGVLRHQPLIPFGRNAFDLVLGLVEKGHRRAMVSENLSEDFGHSSQVGQGMTQALATALTESLTLKQTKSNKIRMLFEEWRTLYGQAADLSVQQEIDIDASLGFVLSDEFIQSNPPVSD